MKSAIETIQTKTKKFIEKVNNNSDNIKLPSEITSYENFKSSQLHLFFI
ncbi:Hemolysin accessory protein (plasmid) [Borrelia crocidurae DOU]|uniref:Hemolysin accessory protein n=1 Tax=Borrelia crocidurae DOU TaxID=1293575 RepID=W5SRN8_9SPIR|nr:Hemolysin accessory protein [Borrelia crocidurae DOU]